MKKSLIFNLIFCVGVLLTTLSCEENDLVPESDTQGTAFATEVDFGISNDAPEVGEDIQLFIFFANDPSDPVQRMVITIEENGVSSTFFEELNPTSTEYILPYSASEMVRGTAVVFILELFSSKDFPQREERSLDVAE